MNEILVSVDWLKQNIGHPKLIILDATFHSPINKIPEEMQGLQIPGAKIFDFDQKICDRSNPLPHMMPNPEQFSAQVRDLGVNQDSLIVVYDQNGIFSSPRARWMFKAMGHSQVLVLDGGLPAWAKAGLPTVPTTQALTGKGNFTATLQPKYFCDADEVMAALYKVDHGVVDARSEARFKGLEPEPRPGLRQGHMPNAHNLFFKQVLQGPYMKPVAELQALFKAQDLSTKKLVFSCGSGVTACIVALAAEIAGIKDLTVYDGSWSEWGLPSERPVVK